MIKQERHAMMLAGRTEDTVAEGQPQPHCVAAQLQCLLESQLLSCSPAGQSENVQHALLHIFIS